MIRRLHFAFLLCLSSLALRAQQVQTAPPTLPVRAMAEWEELQALTITWRPTFSDGTYVGDILIEIVRAAREECQVLISCDNQTSVTSAQNALTNAGVDISSNVTFLVIPNNSIWVRDYGPNCVYANTVDSLYLVDWKYNRLTRPKDDQLPVGFAQQLGIPLYATTQAPADLVNTGGNFMVDGMNTAFASNLILDENDLNNPYGVTPKTETQIDQVLHDYMGIDRYIKMETLPYDAIHHIDMHMKLLDEETLLVGQYPDGVADGPQIEANIQYVLDHFQTSFGTPYKVIRIPMPSDGGSYPDNNGDYRTYSNAVFVNKTVLVPFYEEQYDTTAQRIWEEAMPGYQVIGIECNDIIPSKGAIHCITKEIGVADPLRIVHKPVEGVHVGPDAPWQCSLIADVQHRSGIASVTVTYRRATESTWHSVAMTQLTQPDSTHFWSADIPNQSGYSGKMFYYIDAEANSGKAITRPLPGPDGPWEFPVTLEVSGTAELQQADLLDIYPNPARAITVIPVLTTHSTQGNISILNALGQELGTIFSGTFPAGPSNYFIDASRYTPGTYFVQLQTNGSSVLKKLMVR